MGVDGQAIEALANRFFAAVEAGDLETLTALYHPDVRIWHSRDEADTDLKQSQELLSLFFERVSDRRYEIVRRHTFDGGFVQEHITHGTMKDGSRMALPVCFICHVDSEGRITRIAEYFDATKSPLKGLEQQHRPVENAI